MNLSNLSSIPESLLHYDLEHKHTFQFDGFLNVVSVLNSLGRIWNNWDECIGMVVELEEKLLILKRLMGLEFDLRTLELKE